MHNYLPHILIGGGLLCLLLGGYALHLWKKVWRHKQALALHQQQVQDKLSQDLRILCGSLLDEQVPWLEGCIRIKVILEHYDFELSRAAANQVFVEVFTATEQVPTHDAWKALDKLERRKHEAAFALLEEQHRNGSLAAANRLLEQLGGRFSSSVSAPVQGWSPAASNDGKATVH